MFIKALLWTPIGKFCLQRKYSHKILSMLEPKHKMKGDGWTMQWFFKSVPRTPMTFQGTHKVKTVFDNNTKKFFTFVHFTVPYVYGDISQRLHDLRYCNQLIQLTAEADMIWEYSSLSTLEPDTEEIYKTVKKCYSPSSLFAF